MGAPTYVEIRVNRADEARLDAQCAAALEALARASLSGRAVQVISMIADGVDDAVGEAGVRCLARAVDAMPGIRAAIVVSNGGYDSNTTPALADLQRACGRHGALCVADFVLDADADVHAALSRRPTSLSPLLDASRTLLNDGVVVRWRIPLLAALVHRLEAIVSLARDENVDAMLVPPWSAQPMDATSEPLTADLRRFAHDFLAYRLLRDESPRLSPARAAYYERVREWLERDDFMPPGATDDVSVIAWDETAGRWRARRERRNVDPALMDAYAVDPRGTDSRRRLRRGYALGDIAGVVAEGGRALVERGKAEIRRSRQTSPPTAEPTLPHILVIGAYGGDHIGDAAILGGVLLRMHRRHGTTHATVMSQRPEHTQRLVRMLDSPVAITVREYRQSAVSELVARVDGVVFAGGPLMDLPKQLVKHLYAASLARGAHKPFFIEGIGAGPFVRRLSAWTARRLVKMADRIVVRTADDQRAPLLRGLQSEVLPDPAFDYLHGRAARPATLRDDERQWLERLLGDTEGRVTVGLNLRPIRSDFTTGAAWASQEEYTRLVEARFEERLAEALKRFHKASERAPTFIFFPMNAIQSGSSDLASAYRVRRLVRGDLDFRVWEDDPTLDGVFALMERLDVAITMRFHATIFALARKRPVIGIDYRPGRRDKVAALLDGLGLNDRHRRIDEMTADWLLQQLTRLSNPRCLAAPSA